MLSSTEVLSSRTNDEYWIQTPSLILLSPSPMSASGAVYARRQAFALTIKRPFLRAIDARCFSLHGCPPFRPPRRLQHAMAFARPAAASSQAIIRHWCHCRLDVPPYVFLSFEMMPNIAHYSFRLLTLFYTGSMYAFILSRHTFRLMPYDSLYYWYRLIAARPIDAIWVLFAIRALIL